MFFRLFYCSDQLCLELVQHTVIFPTLRDNHDDDIRNGFVMKSLCSSISFEILSAIDANLNCAKKMGFSIKIFPESARLRFCFRKITIETKQTRPSLTKYL
jgi:hypothetical protein